MKKNILACFLTLSLMLSAMPCRAVDFEAEDLSNAITRAMSIQNLYLQRWYPLLSDMRREALNARAENRSRELIYSLSLSGTYYTGFDIATSYGESNGNLARLYSDAMFLFPVGENMAVGFGLAGFRYGVFITDTKLHRPAQDPYSGSSGVDDFIGTQSFDDLLKLSLQHTELGNLDFDLLVNRTVDPDGGFASGFSPEETRVRFGLNGNFNLPYIGWVYFESLVSTGSDERAVPYLRAGLGTNTPDYVENEFGSFLEMLSLMLGLDWRYYPFLSAGIQDFDFEKFVLELRAKAGPHAYSAHDKVTLSGKIGLFSPALKKETGTYFSYGNLGIVYQSIFEHIRLSNSSLSLSFDLSLYSDPRLPRFGASGNTTIGYLVGASIGINNEMLLLSFNYSWNHMETLQYLVESFDKSSYLFTVKIGY
ncbi:hypothetical protein Ctha_2178 [Chloroherpeton thalassium ATCC 35110]|uniref:DUF5723 domain-containing protein n=1 Tax=Chloroherpeton thalassium (strain ATCC 35110 / GB-78) TaxID=517418 RepID=B3QVX5_CHLT3|nr:hypothetical protein [Chloroherpeton thalassium]ACF14629.1 hypothetical protein Ctha_2178 [Chloroherpeton thalassium ATCC 35110]